MKKQHKKVLKIAAWSVVTPIALFLLLAVLLYLPPVQRWAVGLLSERLSEETGITVAVDEVRLAFPLDLKAGGITAIDKERDTLLAAQELRLNVALRPLFSGEAKVDGFRLSEARLNTKGTIADCQLSGHVGTLAADAPGIRWAEGDVPLSRLRLDRSELYIQLSDTAQKDSLPTPSKWKITFDKADITRSSLLLSLAGDSMHVGATLAKAHLEGGMVNLTKKHYAIRRLDLHDSGIYYDVPRPMSLPDALASLRYRSVGKLPAQLKGNDLDTDHLHFTQLTTRIDSLSYDSVRTLRMNIRHLAAQERSGLHIVKGRAQLVMDSLWLRMNSLELATDVSSLQGSLGLGMRAPMRYDVALRGTLGAKDVKTIGALFLTPVQRRNYPNRPLNADVVMTGTLAHLSFPRLRLSMPSLFRLDAKGWVKQAAEPRRSGSFALDATAGDVTPLLRFMELDLGSTVRIPAGTRAQGKISFAGSRYAADAQLTAPQGGTAHIKGDIDLRTEAYRADITARDFPVRSFLPSYAVAPFSGATTLRGHGFDVLSSKAYLDSKLRIDRWSFAGYDLSGILFDGRITGSSAKGFFSIDNAMLKGSGDADVKIAQRIDLALQATFERIALQKMGLSAEEATLGGTFDITAHTDRAFTVYGLHGTIANSYIVYQEQGHSFSDINVDLESSPRNTEGKLSTGDLEVALTTRGSIPMLAERLQRFVAKYEAQVVKGVVSQEVMKRELPMGTLSIVGGNRNPLASYFRQQGYQWQSLYVDTRISPEEGINGAAHVSGLRLNGLQVDTVDMRIVTDSVGLNLYSLIENKRKRNPNRFTIHSHAYLLDNGVGIEGEYKDANGETGVKLGAEGIFEDGGMRFRLFPTTPVLAYRKFTINEDNYIYLSRKGFYSASIDLLADDGTGVKVYGAPSDTLTDLTVSVHNLNLDELTGALPVLPPLGGLLSGDLHWEDNHKEQSMMMDLRSNALAYYGVKLGDVNLQGVLLPKENEAYYTSAFVSVGDVEGLIFNGTYTAAGQGSIDGKVELTDFPARLLNGFLAGTDVMLNGTAKGDLTIKGSLAHPAINGSLDLDSTRMYSHVYGFSYKLDTRPLEVKDSKFIFDKYRFTSGTEEALTLNGTVDVGTLALPRLDLAIAAKNFEVVNAKKRKESLLYGKVYADFQGTLKGTTEAMTLRGAMNVLPTTEMTYILKDSPLSTDDQLKGLVEFTSFTDTLQTETPIATESSMDIILGINVSEEAKLHCDLSPDGKSYVDIRGGGGLTFRMTRQGDMRLTGRYLMNEGTMEYEMPIIPLKVFTITPGSYVNFTGDPMNPTLNITATEHTKALVTENDVQRSVNFVTGLVITKTLADMGLAFTIEAPDDLSVTNELNAMDKEERGKVAVAMLATGMYLTDQSIANGTGFKTSSALNAFLQREIQNMAGSALKTVNIQLGVDNGTSATGTTTTDYSFQFSKRFMNDRLTVNIGGKVSTGADATNNGSSFIDNISLEYRLDRGASRYVRLFYDRDTQDPFEGLITEAGVGLMLKKKTNNLGELFIFRRNKKKK